jgi:lipooligosaccharide transport system permease protein
MMFLSGVFFPRENLPLLLQHVSAWLPLTQAVELVRPLFMGRWPADVLLHLAVLVLYAAVAWAIALALTRQRFRA